MSPVRKSAISQLLSKAKKRTGSLWRGPAVDGVTFSMLCWFVACRERFRLKYVLGLRPTSAFNKAIEYGNMWHICEEHFAVGGDWLAELNRYVDKHLLQKYRYSADEIIRWRDICVIQFESYIEHWKGHNSEYRTLVKEHVFDVPYTLVNSDYNRWDTVRLRGKYDSLHISEQGKLLYQENKTKGDIDQLELLRRLPFDFQSMLYLSTIQSIDWKALKLKKKPEIHGVLYNVVKRPLSGGKGSIKQKGNETSREFLERLRVVIDENRSEFFMRWDTPIKPNTINQFEGKTLIPLLHQLNEWWQYMESVNFDPWNETAASNSIHWVAPFIERNPLLEGGGTDYDNLITSGDQTGLSYSEELFSELKPITV